MNETDEYEGQEPLFEVVWLCEPDEENDDGILGAGMYEPRTNFYTEDDAMLYIKNEQLRSRAIINYYKVVEGELECVRDKIIEVKKND